MIKDVSGYYINAVVTGHPTIAKCKYIPLNPLVVVHNYIPLQNSIRTQLIFFAVILA